MCIRRAERPAGLRASRVTAALVAVAGVILPAVACAQGYPARFELGTAASEQDIAPIAIAVPSDGKGLPPGSGDYARGKTVYESACAACHGADLMGVAGLPNMPNGAQLRLIGGRGTLATKNPVLTVESYWPYATTLFDYVRRAMPFTAPGSLAANDIYAVCAYILAEGHIVDKSTVLDAKTLPRVAMPNREGFIPDPRPERFK
jgi:S-disulfanyl-L-cysteine oxidoreductase SoxD